MYYAAPESRSIRLLNTANKLRTAYVTRVAGGRSIDRLAIWHLIHDNWSSWEARSGVDLDRVAQCEKVFEKIYCEVEPGTAILFHPNLLHRSDQNRSDRPRWSLISCYTGQSNLPYKDTRHPGYEPVKRVEDCAIKQTGSLGAQVGKRYLAFEKSDGFTTKEN